MSSKAASPPRGQIPALDGLRGIAVLTVMIFHFTIFGEMTADNFLDAAYRGFIIVGWSGVDLFFVLSGFLITGIILDAKESPHFFRNFYGRRFLRIFPLYYVFLALYFFVIGHFFPAFTQQTVGQEAWYWTYTCNILAARQGYLDSTISHFWSLAVEEQFYLVWPLLAYLLSSRALLRTCLGLMVASLTLRTVLVSHHAPFPVFYGLTPCRIDTLAAGAIVALLLRGSTPREFLVASARKVLVAMTAVLAILFVWRHGLHNHDAVVGTLGYTVVALTYSSLTLLAVMAPPTSSLTRWLSDPRLRFFGRYSYGMYVLHAPLGHALLRAGIVIPRFPRVAGSHLPLQALFIVGGIGLTTLGALVSWYLLEAPVLRFKRYFEYRETPAEEMPAPSATASAESS